MQDARVSETWQSAYALLLLLPTLLLPPALLLFCCRVSIVCIVWFYQQISKVASRLRLLVAVVRLIHGFSMDGSRKQEHVMRLIIDLPLNDHFRQEKVRSPDKIIAWTSALNQESRLFWNFWVGRVVWLCRLGINCAALSRSMALQMARSLRRSTLIRQRAGGRRGAEGKLLES